MQELYITITITKKRRRMDLLTLEQSDPQSGEASFYLGSRNPQDRIWAFGYKWKRWLLTQSKEKGTGNQAIITRTFQKERQRDKGKAVRKLHKDQAPRFVSFVFEWS